MGGFKDVFNFITNMMHLVDTLSYVIIRYFLREDSPLKTYNISKKNQRTMIILNMRMSIVFT